MIWDGWDWLRRQRGRQGGPRRPVLLSVSPSNGNLEKGGGQHWLRFHLLLDPLRLDGPTLYVFHYKAFLKAQLDHLQEGGFKKEDSIRAYFQRHIICPLTRRCPVVVAHSNCRQRLPATAPPGWLRRSILSKQFSSTLMIIDRVIFSSD
jgi:hypothetical protein